MENRPGCHTDPLTDGSTNGKNAGLKPAFFYFDAARLEGDVQAFDHPPRSCLLLPASGILIPSG